MLFPRADSRLICDPLEILDQPVAGYILDLTWRFRDSFDWRFDQESLHGLLLLALRHFPELGAGVSGTGISPPYVSLIRRLQIAGDLVCDGSGLALTDRGEERRRLTFHAVLAAPEWRLTLERIGEDMAVFAETEGICAGESSF